MELQNGLIILDGLRRLIMYDSGGVGEGMFVHGQLTWPVFC